MHTTEYKQINLFISNSYEKMGGGGGVT